MKKAPPRSVQLNIRASHAFKRWLALERERTGLTLRELCDHLAIGYIAFKTRHGKAPTKWPED